MYPVGIHTINHSLVVLLSSKGVQIIHSVLKRDPAVAADSTELPTRLDHAPNPHLLVIPLGSSGTTSSSDAWVVCVRAEGFERGGIVKTAVDTARSLTRHLRSQSDGDPKADQLEHYWRGLGACSWEGIRSMSEDPPWT